MNSHLNSDFLNFKDWVTEKLNLATNCKYIFPNGFSKNFFMPVGNCCEEKQALCTCEICVSSPQELKIRRQDTDCCLHTIKCILHVQCSPCSHFLYVTIFFSINYTWCGYKRTGLMLEHLLFKKLHNRNVVTLNVLPSAIPTPLHANFPLLEAMLQVVFW